LSTIFKKLYIYICFREQEPYLAAPCNRPADHN
jgi:hypothetical protein